MTVHRLIDELCDALSPDGRPLLVDNVELLFSPELGKINPVDTFKRMSRQRPIVLALPARPQDGVRLIQVPLVPWGNYIPALRSLSQASPAQVMATQTRWLDLQVLQVFAGGCTPQEAADALSIAIKTVDTHKTVILAECRNAWRMDDSVRPDYHFLREKFGPFFGQI